ncbi:MAG: TolC family protein [Kiritimatiellaeota bacterium]|nr:TolC family protein [Kiritimatiellota bacterium]
MAAMLHRRGWIFFTLLGMAGLLALTACMTPERADREAGEAGTRLATAYWQAQTGCTNTFDVSRPSEALTLRLALMAVARGDEGVVFPEIPNVEAVVVDDVWRLSLADALNVAARNDRQYQRLKEDIFRTALDLDSQQFLFETSFTGLLLGWLSGNTDSSRSAEASGSAGVGFRRQFENGSVIMGNLALDVAHLLRNDWHSIGLTGDLTMTIPLLRGSGRDVVREPLTQAERNLMYAIRRFEHYRQTYMVTVTSGFFDVLKCARLLRNAQDNETFLTDNNKRATMMFEEARMRSIEADQAHSDLLSASEGVVSARRYYEERLDVFKLTIGLPPESRIELDALELDTLQQAIEGAANEGTGGERMFPDEPDACALALAQRLDLSIVYDALGDAERQLKVAADALRADVALRGTARSSQVRTSDDSRFSGRDNWGTGIDMDLPWNRRRERNNYKRQLIAVEQAKRNIEEQEDVIKAAVRNGLRSLAAAEAAYKIQVAALHVAEKRVQSNTLFMELGLSSMRDVLEAQSALLRVQNNLCAAVIAWHISELELRRDMGTLVISETRLWRPMETLIEGVREDNG